MEHALPALVGASLAHALYETIHPFLDGNGRLGRLLIVLMLLEAGVLQEPLLYLSLFLKQHCSRYYELLDGICSCRVHGPEAAGGVSQGWGAVCMAWADPAPACVWATGP